jgi:hypothetical protein
MVTDEAEHALAPLPQREHPDDGAVCVGHRLRHASNCRGRTVPRRSMRLLALLPMRH